MGNLGDLVVSLEANIAQFNTDMNRAAQNTETAMGKINGMIDMVKSGLQALGVGVSVGAFAALVKGSIDAADNLRDMSQKTGVAVETLNGMGFAAGQAGGNLESIAAAAGKVNKTIVEAAGGNKDAAEGFSKLGISVRDAHGNLKSADVVIAEVADKFKTFADGPEKSAIAVRIFGKAGAEMIPVLNDGGDAMRENIEYAKKYSGVTQDLTEAADNFNDTMGKLTVQQNSFGNAMATAVLPVLQLVANELLTAAEESDKFSLASEVVRTVLETFVVVGSEVAFTFKAVGTEIGGIAAQLDRLAHGDVKGFTIIGDAMKRDAEEARKAHDAFIASVLDRTPRAAQSVTDGWDDDPKKKPAPRLRAAGDDPTKALLDAQLKGIESAYAQERDVATFHSQFMDGLRALTIVDMEQYETFKKASIQEGLESSIRAYDAEIAALENYRAAAGKETERAEASGKIKEKLALKEKARIDAEQANALLELNNAKVRGDLVKKWQAESDAFDAQMESKFLSVRKSLLSTTEAENEQFAERMDALVRFNDAQIANVEYANEMIEREKQRHAEATAGIQAAANLEALSMAGRSSDQLYNLLQQAGMEQTALGKALFIANKAIAVAEIIMNTEVAAAKALTMGPIIGPPLAMTIRGLGYASAGIVIGTTIASARDGFDIPKGVNPVTQLHEEEMVLPKAQANVIRGLADGGGGRRGPTIHYAPVFQVDARADRAQAMREMQTIARQANADLVERMTRKGIIG